MVDQPATNAIDRLAAERRRYVAAGLTTPGLVVERALGARLWDPGGRSYIDFAGGIASQNLGHGFGPAVAAIHHQADRFLHQCAMVATYEPYVEVCRRLADLSPCGRGDQKSLLVSSGAEAVENAVKIARWATGRPGVVVFDGAFHGRTLLTMAMTAKVVPYKRGFGPFPPDVHRAPAPYPYRGVDTVDAIAGLEHLFKVEVDPESIACVVLEPVQGEGGFIPMPPAFPRLLRELCDRHGILYVDDEVQAGMGRTGPVWAIEHYGIQPDLVVSGKSLGGGLPLAAVTGPASIVDAVPPGGLGGTFGGNPLACAAAIPVLDAVASPEVVSLAEALGARLNVGLEAIASRVRSVGEVRGLGPMQALELVEDRASKEPAPELAARTVRIALDQGLVLLTCGTYGNVIRILPPLTASDSEIVEGLALLESSLVGAGAG